MLFMKMLTLSFLVFFTACSSSVKKTSSIILTQDSYVTVGESTPTLVKSGESIPKTTDPILVESPGHLSLLLLDQGGKSEVEVTLRPLSESNLGSEFKKINKKNMEEVLLGVWEVQNLLATQNSPLALDKASSLVAKFPDIQSLKVLQASCLVANGNRSGAISVLNSVLDSNIGFAPARELLDVLSKRSQDTQLEVNR